MQQNKETCGNVERNVNVSHTIEVTGFCTYLDIKLWANERFFKGECSLLANNVDINAPSLDKKLLMLVWKGNSELEMKWRENGKKFTPHLVAIVQSTKIKADSY